MNSISESKNDYSSCSEAKVVSVKEIHKDIVPAISLSVKFSLANGLVSLVGYRSYLTVSDQMAPRHVISSILRFPFPHRGFLILELWST